MPPDTAILEPAQTQTVPAAQPQPAQTTQTPSPAVGQTPAVPEPSVQDIVAKVTAKKEPKPQDTGGTFKEFDDIADPALRERMISREKERIADYTRKTQVIAEERRAVERQQKEMESWDEHKIQKYLLNNPTFLQAAQRIAAQPSNPTGSGLTDEQFSALNPAEKNQLLTMNREISELRQQNLVSAMNQKDAALQTKYGDYDALRVNQGLHDLSRISPVDLREHVYKAVFHDDHVQAAYEMGRKEAQGLNQQRVQAATTSNGFVVSPANDRPLRNKGETDQGYFVRLADYRLAQSRSGTVIRK